MNRKSRIHISPKIQHQLSKIPEIDVFVEKRLFRKPRVIIFIGLEKFII